MCSCTTTYKTFKEQYFDDAGYLYHEKVVILKKITIFVCQDNHTSFQNGRCHPSCGRQTGETYTEKWHTVLHWDVRDQERSLYSQNVTYGRTFTSHWTDVESERRSICDAHKRYDEQWQCSLYWINRGKIFKLCSICKEFYRVEQPDSYLTVLYFRPWLVRC